jgi:adenylate cyclase
MSSIFKSHSFYIKIVTAFIGLLVLTVLPIVSYNYYQNRQMALESSDDLMAQITATVMEKTENYFVPAAVLVEISARLAELGAVCCGNEKQLELFTLGALQSFPMISMFFIGDEQGNYIRAWRLPDGNLEARIINRSAVPASNTFKYWTPEFKVFKTETSTEIDYDPRVRPWYIGAKAARGNYWTDVYILFRNKKPAVTSAYPVIDPQGRIVGVWGVDIELDEISNFLKSLKIGKNGLVFIFNAKNEVMAFPDVSRIIKEEKGELRPVRVDELGSGPISRAFQEYLKTGKSKPVIESDGKRFLAAFADFPQEFPARWKVGIVVPEEDFITGAKRLIGETLLICLVILLAAIFLAVFIARSISKPIKQLAAETQKIKDFHLDDRIEATSHIKEIQLMSNAIAAMKSGLQAFRRYVPAELVRQLIHTGEEARLGGQKRELTVFFSDISGFTSIAERLTPEELMLHLSEYFDQLTRILTAEQGTVDKYIGDGILAFWGAPRPDEEHARHACNAALLCQERLRELNRKWQDEGKTPFTTRIGISTGETVVGNVGSSERINYTVMGDNVNLASRLEGVNKIYGTRIIVARATCEAVSAHFWLRPLDVVAVKGKSEGAMIYELVGRKSAGEGASEAEALCTEFSRGLAAYRNRDWDRACTIFAGLSDQFPQDGPAKLYLSRCRHYREQPPAADWRGVEHLEVK